MGFKISNEIGKEVESKVIPRAQAATENENKKQNYMEQIKILILECMYFRSQSRNLTVWHWCTKEDSFVNHHGQIYLRHDSIPNWGWK
ncbi:hypothetical protein M3589_07845 [Heyndrickxia oleronia]|uniref:hypothetical protein n=1 Tax=Heyndrickxia oleronia TaxID=38875 RepID=UPI00203C6B83|nr:hypothetical protein [Heyndrickxia oleronia]MCM3237636.1 hypothetical protein [Heyndrickxia oleronia]